MTDAGKMYVLLNGALIPETDAAVSIDDRGLLYGESVFTTMRVYGGAPFRLERHCARLNASLASPVVGIDHSVEPAQLAADVRRLLKLNGLRDAVARLVVTRGEGAGPLPPPQAEPLALLTVRPYAPPEELRARGAALIVSSVRRDPAGQLGRHKLGSYIPCLLARREAAARGADEAVITDTHGAALECACSNLFAVEDGALVTPDAAGNLLPGVAREVVLECAAALGLPIRLEAALPLDRLARAAELFLTNSLQEIIPVARLDDAKFPVPGPLTTQLIKAYRQTVLRETSRGEAKS